MEPDAIKLTSMTAHFCEVAARRSRVQDAQLKLLVGADDEDGAGGQRQAGLVLFVRVQTAVPCEESTQRGLIGVRVGIPRMQRSAKRRSALSMGKRGNAARS